MRDCFHKYPKVADVWGGRQNGAVDVEKEVMCSFGEGFGTNQNFVRFVKVQLEDGFHTWFNFSKAVGQG